jgi:hypothetical protein
MADLLLRTIPAKPVFGLLIISIIGGWRGGG